MAHSRMMRGRGARDLRGSISRWSLPLLIAFNSDKCRGQGSFLDLVRGRVGFPWRCQGQHTMCLRPMAAVSHGNRAGAICLLHVLDRGVGARDEPWRELVPHPVLSGRRFWTGARNGGRVSRFMERVLNIDNKSIIVYDFQICI